jgi:hypothetical protein
MKRMLPLAASLMMGAFTQQKSAEGMASLAGAAAEGGLMDRADAAHRPESRRLDPR